MHCGRPATKRPNSYKATKASFEACYITRREAAARLGVSTTTFDKWRAENRAGA